MKEIGLFYAMNAAKTSHIAEKIREKLGHKEVEMIMIEKAWQNDFQAYDKLIVGASTWFDGELPTYWDEMIPEIESLDLKDKKVLGGRKGGMPEMVFEYILRKNELDPQKDLTIDQSIDFGSTAAAFSGG